MAVYTPVTRTQLETFLAEYDLGPLESFEGIEQGVSNTNYHLYTGQGHYVLTLFEPHRVEPEDIPFFLNYAAHLSARGIQCPAPVFNKTGGMLGILAGRQAVIVPFMAGENNSFDSVTPEKCVKAGRMLARMHKAAEDFSHTLSNKYGHTRKRRWLDAIGARLDTICPGLQDMAEKELAWQEESWPGDLPKGAIHADYFPDNVLFNMGEISAVLDFHFACTDFFAYDLAITVNAWCFSERQGIRFEEERYAALMEGYETVRPLSREEKTAFPVLLRGPALRTTLARCEELLNHKPDDLMTPHDPQAYIKRLEHWQK